MPKLFSLPALPSFGSAGRVALLLAVILCVVALSHFGSLKKVLEGFVDDAPVFVLYHSGKISHSWYQLKKNLDKAGIKLKLDTVEIKDLTTVNKAGLYRWMDFPAVFLYGHGKTVRFYGIQTAKNLQTFLVRELPKLGAHGS